jgi:hypothetical protein
MIPLAENNYLLQLALDTIDRYTKSIAGSYDDTHIFSLVDRAHGILRLLAWSGQLLALLSEQSQLRAHGYSPRLEWDGVP